MELKTLLKKLNLSTFIAFDFETTGLDQQNDRIIEIAAIRFVQGKSQDRFVKLVNPGRPISKFITDITGISNAMVSDAPSENDIVKDFLNFLGSDPLVAHNTPFDVGFLKELNKRSGIKWESPDLYDTLQLARTFIFDQPTFNLGSVSEYFNLSAKGSHRAEKDTENCGAIFISLINEAASYPLEVISKILEMIKSTAVMNKPLFVSLANELMKSGDLKKGLTRSKIVHPGYQNVYSHSGHNDIDKMTIDNIFKEGGLLEKSLDQFEYRSAQVDYAKMIESILIKEESIGVIEAGTGLGKSIAYLISCLKRKRDVPESGPTVISCHTKHLQDQLFYKDLPLITEALDVPIRAVKLKGRNNYICISRLNWLISDAKKILNGSEIANLIPILIWLHWTKTGDMTECNGFWNSRPGRLAYLIQSEPGYCTTNICTKNAGCFFGKVRSAVYEAEIIIINHALLLTESILPGFLPVFNALIIDEAHNIVPVAYNQLTLQMDQTSQTTVFDSIDPTFRTNKRIKNLLTKLCGLIPEFTELIIQLDDGIKNCRHTLKKLFENLSAQHASDFNLEAVYREKIIVRSLNESYCSLMGEINQLDSDIRNILSLLEKFNSLLTSKDPEKDDYPELFQAFQKHVDLLTGSLHNISSLFLEQLDNWIYWKEGQFKLDKNRINQLHLSLHACPVDISEPLSKLLFKRIDHCILTSATLRVDDTFEYFSRRTGLDKLTSKSIKSAQYLSPFYYDDQVTYLQYGGNANISNNPEAIASIIYKSHKSNNRRIMALFTSRNALINTDAKLRLLGGNDLPLFSQKNNVSRQSMISGMRNTTNGILLGTSSFWEGVDFPGDLLEVLVITKIPFDVPTEPSIKAYSEMIDQSGGNSFMEYSIPEAVIKFRQGFGRLIRTISDEGTFMNLDNRVLTRSYGRHFSDAIPVTMKVFTNLDVDF